MKKYTLLCVGLCAVMAFTSCKSSESAYKKAYEKAKQAEPAAQPQTEEAPVVAPVEAKPANEGRVYDNLDNVSVRQENVSLISGSGLKAYSVVVGSFGVRANADGLQQRLKDAGYDAQIVKRIRICSVLLLQPTTIRVLQQPAVISSAQLILMPGCSISDNKSEVWPGYYLSITVRSVPV